MTHNDDEVGWIDEFSRIRVVSVYVMPPGEVPSAVPDEFSRERNLSPESLPEVVAGLFVQNPKTETIAHSDGFVYDRYTWERDARQYLDGKPKELCIQGVSPNLGTGAETIIPYGIAELSREEYVPTFSKSRNLSEAIKAMLEGNRKVIAYFDALRRFVGREIPTEKVYPPFKKFDQHGSYTIPGFDVSPFGSFVIGLDDMLYRVIPSSRRVAESGNRLSGISVWECTEEQGVKILRIGDIEWEGVTKKE